MRRWSSSASRVAGGRVTRTTTSIATHATSPSRAQGDTITSPDETSPIATCTHVSRTVFRAWATTSAGAAFTTIGSSPGSTASGSGALSS